MDWTRGAYTISTDPSRLDRETIHGYLVNSYWAKGIPREVVDRSIDHSVSFGLYEGRRQVAFARVITDRATYAYLADVFVLETHRGKGLGKWLVEVILGHPELSGLRRWSLVTRDAHGLYSPFGFTPLSNPERYMEIVDPGVYRQDGPGRR
jgi:GNAT superfamily N-acetyltransferase